MKDLRKVGGWGWVKGSIQGKIMNHTKIKCECEVCKHNFTMTKDRNILEEMVLIPNRRGFVTGDRSKLSFIQKFFGAKIRINLWDKSNQYSSICPNCEHIEPKFANFIKTISEEEVILPD